MFNRDSSEAQTDVAYQRLIRELTNHPVTSKEYAEILERAAKLQKLKTDDRPKPLSKDALLAATANILGIAMIIHHEQFGIVTTKALSFVKFR